ncbi:hypothetical protein BGZ60DRAFT_431790 [Tricladium varicosporioides]|nr:hypothetical protein BGZ60DRAFT_431790 [Hymenoscyphus varicosporioides]
MAKSSSQVNSGGPRLVLGVRGRDVEFPRAPVRVTDTAQAKLVDINTARKFDFGGHDRGAVPERPSTSAGPASKSKRRNAEKRETKDDLHFNPLAAHGTGTTFYNFPLPGSLPTPVHTPSQESLPPRKSSLDPHPPRTLTPDSMQAAPANMAVPQMEIGMALGSPSHQPTDWSQQVYTENNTRVSSPDAMEDFAAETAAPAKPKASRWKILGGFFGGKKQAQAQPQPFYQLQPEPATNLPEADFSKFGEPTATEEKAPKTRGRGRSISGKKQKGSKTDMKRANTVPANATPLRFDFQDNGRTPTPEILLDGGPLNTNTNHSGHNGQYHGVLDVDIPSIQMERYSIMFGSVLQKPTTTSSALLARRQATLDKLKTVNEALASKEQEIREKERSIMPRRATSPQPTRSPAFSLFPNTPSRQGYREASPSRLRAGTLQRSNTSPAALSPSRPSFAPGLDNEAHAILVSTPNGFAKTANVPIHPAHHKGHVKQNSDESAKSHLPSARSKIERSWSPEESHLVLDSPKSGDEDDGYTLTPGAPSPMVAHSAAPLKPKLVEPTWEIINRPQTNDNQPPKTASSTSGSDHSTSTSTSSTSASSVSTAATAHSEPQTAHTASAKHKPIVIPSQVQVAQAAAFSQPLPQTFPMVKPASNSVPRSRRNPSEASNASIASSNFSVHGHQGTVTTTITGAAPTDEEEKEARLKTAADVSIARQISVSRQQRQLLVPIKGSLRGKSASSNSLNNKFIGNQGLSPLNTNTPNSAVSIGRAASPLGAVAIASSEETGRINQARGGVESPLLGNAMAMGNLGLSPMTPERKERLVEGVKPSTPTLVFVPGPKDNEKVEAWGVQNQGGTQQPVGLAERRKGKGVVMGEIKVGLEVRSRERSRTVGERRDNGRERERGPNRVDVDLQHRKSERVVVETLG